MSSAWNGHFIFILPRSWISIEKWLLPNSLFIFWISSISKSSRFLINTQCQLMLINPVTLLKFHYNWSDLLTNWLISNTKYKEYAASLIGLYKNNGAVSCVGIYFLFMLLCCKQLTYRVHPGVSHGVNFKLPPNHIGFCHGQILIETATYSFRSIHPLRFEASGNLLAGQLKLFSKLTQMW